MGFTSRRPRRSRRAAWSVLAVVLLLTACTPPEDTTDAADEAPASDQAAAAAPAPGDKWCSDVSIAAFPGGGQGTPFTNNVHNGYQAAAADLGADVTYYFSDWSEEKMVAQFREALALEPDGMAVMGHPGDEAMGPLIDEAYEQGIQVTVVNVELPQTAERWAPDGLGYVGAPNYAAGERLAQEAVERSGAQAGETAFVWGLQAQPGAVSGPGASSRGSRRLGWRSSTRRSTRRPTRTPRPGHQRSPA
jgi:simple sugar transport system substrate-binding protein